MRCPSVYTVVTYPVSRPSSPVDATHVGSCRELQLYCSCPAYSQKDPTIVDPLLCDAFNTIDAVLPAFPRLTTLHLRVQYIDVHGISWNTMRTILSLPHLRHLHIDRLYVCPELLDCDSLDDATVAPLATFHYVMPFYRQPWSFPSEVATLDFLVHKLHASLESLVLPVEPAPIQAISTLQWPRLREFALRGERWSDPSTPIVSLFSSMPSVQSLAFELSEPENAVAGMIWPKGSSATFPWPNLKRLCVSCPNPTDEIYMHLPPSLRALALRSWPHECIRIYYERRAHLRPSWLQGYRRRWRSHFLSTPRNLAQVLQKCEPSLFSSLELEYRVDAQEPELLQVLAVKFSHLTTLEVHRFRREGSYEVTLVSPRSSSILRANSLTQMPRRHVVDRVCGSSGAARVPPLAEASPRFPFYAASKTGLRRGRQLLPS